MYNIHDFRPRQSLVLALSLLVAAIFFISPVEAADLPHPADPFADPKHDPYNPLKYIASNVLTGTAFSLMLCVAVLQTWCTFKYGAKWMLPMVIGAYTFSLGLSIRFALHSNPESKGLYTVEYMFVVLSPCAFIAANYVLLGRLARHLYADEFLLIGPQRITKVFVASDISTFLIQATGGSLTASSANLPSRARLGSHIFLIGLALQLASFVIFVCISMLFMYRVYKFRPETWIRDQGRPWYSDWRTLAVAFAISCIGLLIRCTYRVVELSQGFEGPLATSETFFYILDTLPLFNATAVYIPFWPGRFIQDSSDGVVHEDKANLGV